MATGSSDKEKLPMNEGSSEKEKRPMNEGSSAKEKQPMDEGDIPVEIKEPRSSTMSTLHLLPESPLYVPECQGFSASIPLRPPTQHDYTMMQRNQVPPPPGPLQQPWNGLEMQIPYQTESFLRPLSDFPGDNDDDEWVNVKQIFGNETPLFDPFLQFMAAAAASQQNINPSELTASLPNSGVSFAPNLRTETAWPVVSSSIPREIGSEILRNQHWSSEAGIYLPAPTESSKIELHLGSPSEPGKIRECQFSPDVNASFQMLRRNSIFAPDSNYFVTPPLDNPVACARRNELPLDLSLHTSNPQLGLQYELYNHQLSQKSNFIPAENRLGIHDLEAHASHGPDMVTRKGDQPPSQVRMTITNSDILRTRNEQEQVQPGEAQEQKKATEAPAEIKTIKILGMEINYGNKRNYMLEKATTEKGESSNEGMACKVSKSFLCEQLSIYEAAKVQISSSFKEIEQSQANKCMSNESPNNCYRVPDLNLVADDWESPEAAESELSTKFSETEAEKAKLDKCEALSSVRAPPK